MPAHVLGWGGDEPTASWVRGVALMDRRVARRVDVAEGDAAGEANLDVRDGSSEAVDRPAVRRVSRRHPDDDGDTELSQPVPNSDQLVAEAVTLAAAEIKKDPQLCELVAHYWRLVPDEELVGRTPEEMLVATVSHRELAAQRLPGELKLRVGETLDGYHTAVEIVTDDMPFLVDSVTGALAGELDIHLLVHPVVVVRREVFGALEEVRLGVEPDEAGQHDVVESWIRIETDRVRDEATLEEVRRDLTRVLNDVREAVEDWPKMRTQALTLADELATAQLPVPDKDITDSVELLRWLADDHFTFLGYREYKLFENEKVLQAVLGTGLGILRSDQTMPRVLSSMSPEAHGRALEKRLLIITKANSRATVHRTVYLDYIGFKMFDLDGNVVGERRFLGLFSSAAYRTSVRELPVVKRKVATVLERSGLSPRSHSGKDLMEILETYPRDELFQISTDDLYRSVMGVLRLAGRRQLKLFIRRDAYGRFISCLVYLPRDRRGLHHTGQRVAPCAGALHRAYRSGGPAGGDRRRRPVREARRRDPAVGRGLPAGPGAQAGRGAGQGAVLPLRRGAARHVQGRAHAVRGGQGRGQARAARRAGRAGHARVPPPPGRRRRPVQDLPVRRADGPVQRAARAALPGRTGHRRTAVRGTPPGRHHLPVRLRPQAAAGLPGAGGGTRPRGERVLGGLARRGGDRRVQRARAARRFDLAPGRGAAGVREVPAPGRHGLLAGVHGDHAAGVPGNRGAAHQVVRDAVRPAPATVR